MIVPTMLLASLPPLFAPRLSLHFTAQSKRSLMLQALRRAAGSPLDPKTDQHLRHNLAMKRWQQRENMFMANRSLAPERIHRRRHDQLRKLG